MRATAFLVSLVLLLACTEEVVAPARPRTVPASATWSGGVDGGAWIACRLSYKEPHVAYACRTFTDDGQPWAAGTYVLADIQRSSGGTVYVPSGALARADAADFISFTGVTIRLAGERALIPHGTIDMPFSDGGGERAEYVLGSEVSTVQYEAVASP